MKSEESLAAEAFVETQLRRLTLKQNRSAFIFGFMGDDLSHGLQKTISEQQPGGIIVFVAISKRQSSSQPSITARKVWPRNNGTSALRRRRSRGRDVIRVRTASPLPSALALGELIIQNSHKRPAITRACF